MIMLGQLIVYVKGLKKLEKKDYYLLKRFRRYEKYFLKKGIEIAINTKEVDQMLDMLDTEKEYVENQTHNGTRDV